ncbi:Lactonase, 7-bladed beta-propeller-domain-containing protein [Boeremia exigua]|uniref:Lactonase, 7-bladed beta-propeller-domain-containing protein n=1 Tax=Boeremia exigua TaxID=749465 RepID=UPI001E8CA750|nr:Lactonase, 7-bladed beta-propeller-domain-containing protein [Boeremia exigua]KAH6616696.1 Lactonase, 7-bladed beta-propeller-domain-containing protein [Boeremia exigua]
MLPTQTLLFPFFGGAAAAANLYASHYSGSITHLTFNSNSLAIVSSEKTGQTLPSWITYDSVGKKLYVPDENFLNGNAVLVSYSTNAKGALTKTGNTTTPNGGVSTVLYGGKDGRGFIATAHYQTAQISTYKLPLKDGKPLQTVEYTLDGPGANPDRQEAPHPHQVLVDPTGEFLLVPDLGSDKIHINKIDKKSGKLTPCPSTKTIFGAGPRHAAFWSPSYSKTRVAPGAGTVLYVANELSNTVTGWSVSYPHGGCLSLTQGQSITPYKGNSSAPVGTSLGEIRVQGNFLYTSNRADQSFKPYDSLTQYTIASNGALAWTALTSSYGLLPRSFEINKAGDYVAIGGQTSDNVAIVKRDVATGRLGALVANVTVTGPLDPNSGGAGLNTVIWAE